MLVKVAWVCWSTLHGGPMLVCGSLQGYTDHLHCSHMLVTVAWMCWSTLESGSMLVCGIEAGIRHTLASYQGRWVI